MSAAALLDRSRLPDLVAYLGQLGASLRGRGSERRGRCPIAEHGSRDPFAVNVDGGTWFCHACGAGGDVIALHQARTGLGFADAVRDLGGDLSRTPAQPLRPMAEPPAAESRPVDTKRHQTAAAIWRSAVPIRGTLAHRYLEHRGCRLPPADGDLRFMPVLALFGFAGSAMVARMSTAEDATVGRALHVTWLKPDGSGRLERRYLGPKAGAVIRLWPDEAVATGLAVAEGIETALAAAHAFTPVWATADAGNLASLPVLTGIEALTVFADHDASGTGQAAAAELAERWLAAGREVTVLMPDRVGADIADEVAA